MKTAVTNVPAFSYGAAAGSDVRVFPSPESDRVSRISLKFMTTRIVTVYVPPVQRLRPGDGRGRAQAATDSRVAAEVLMCVYNNMRLFNGSGERSILGVLSSRRSRVASATAGIYYYPSDQRSFVPAPPPTVAVGRSVVVGPLLPSPPRARCGIQSLKGSAPDPTPENA